MPGAWRDELRQAALLGYGERISRLLDQAVARDSILAERLRGLAAAYDHRAILDLLEQAEGAE